MHRGMTTALLDQLSRDLPLGGTSAADDFNYGWFRERVESIVVACSAADAMYVWQYALWRLDAAGLLPDGATRRHRS